MPTELEWSYFAGILDGEGCITLSLRKYRKPDSISHRVLVYNTDSKLLDWIHERFGGSMRIHIREDHNNRDGVYESYGRKTVYRLDWCIVADVEKVLSGTIPYLIVKKDAAEMVLGLLSSNHPKDRLELFELIKEVQSNGK